MRRWNGTVVALAAALAASCGGAPEPVALRLLDLFDAATIEQTVEVEPLDPTEWRFDGDGTIAAPEPPEDEEEAEDFEDRSATVGWAAYHDVEGLEVRDGRLVGTAGELPLLHAARPEELDENDLLHAVEITMRVSAGTRVGVTFNGARELDEERVLRGIRRAPTPALFAELEPGEDVQTYTLQDVARSFSIAGIRHLLVQPTDEPGATFEIESVRLIPRTEHLRSVTSGPGWQGWGRSTARRSSAGLRSASRSTSIFRTIPGWTSRSARSRPIRLRSTCPSTARASGGGP